MIYTKEEIIIGLTNSDRKVIMALYKEGAPLINSLVSKNNISNIDYKEILHDGITIMFEKAIKGNFILTCEATTYLYSVCRNILLKRFDKNKQVVELVDACNFIALDNGYNFIENEKDQIEYLRKILNTVGNTCKTILELYYFEKLKMDEIAEKLNYTNADNAKTQKYKCLKKLKVVADKNIMYA